MVYFDFVAGRFVSVIVVCHRYLCATGLFAATYGRSEVA